MRRRPALPFPAAERAIQRLWAERRLQLPARAASGAVIEVIDPGEWNRLGGPDFLGAELRIDGERARGDVEVELNPGDWVAHGHARNPAFRGVALHAVLFGPARPVRTSSGATPEALVLLPLLPEDLEAVAEHDALAELRGRGPELERAIREANPDLEPDLRRRARGRFEAKLARLARRAEAEGWAATCHRASVEALGHGGNRAPMADLARRHGTEGFVEREPEELYLEQSGRWRLRGVRPAGHPHRRLADYARLCQDRRGWVAGVRAWLAEAARGRETRAGLLEGVLGGVLPEALADTLATDAWLPLGGEALADLWLDWPAGLRPDGIDEVRSRLGFAGKARNWQVQGMLHALGRAGKG